MRLAFTFIIILIFNTFYSQKNELKSFNLNEYNELIKRSCYKGEIKTFGNKNSVTFKRNDSIINMSYHKDGISHIMKTCGNYYVTYDYHSNLKIKSKKECISAISRSGSLQVGLEKEYDENGLMINQFNYDKMDYKEDIRGPKKTVWEIAHKVKKEHNFDILHDKSLFGIRLFLDEKTKKIKYLVSKVINDENKLLRLCTYEYDGDSGNLIKMYNSEFEIDEDLRHY